jgi:tetratricopeptide (TPR) repeat protein
MRIDVIDSSEAFAQVRANWESVYDVDPGAQFFLSWIWMSAYLDTVDSPWFILAAKPRRSSPYVAFFPLRLRTKIKRGSGFYNDVIMAGNAGADYTGFICKPEFQDDVIPAFARHIQQLHWTNLHLDNIWASDNRFERFLKYFPTNKFAAAEFGRVNERDNINNCICPYVKLASDWEAYLTTNLSSNTRQKLRRFLKQVETSGEFRITHADADTIERDVKILLRFWGQKWGPRKGDRLRGLLKYNFNILTRCFQSGSLFLPVLWKGETPLGALGSFIDTKKKSFLFYIGARDETFNSPPPGLVLHAYSIRYAINNGFTTYDFLRGNEPYKYSFGAEERYIKCIVVSTKNGRNLGGKVDRRCLPDIRQRTNTLHKNGHLSEAEHGYRQILDVDPRCTMALHGLGQVMAAKGDHEAARRLFTSLLTAEPDSHKVWFELGFSLCKLGKFDNAIASFESALHLQPDYAEAEISLANVLYLTGKLSAEKRTHYALLNVNFADKVRQNGAIGRAVNCYKQAINMKPDLVEAHYGLGLAFQAQGNIESAAQSYRKVLELQPGHRDVLTLLAELSPPSTSSAVPLHATSTN